MQAFHSKSFACERHSVSVPWYPRYVPPTPEDAATTPFGVGVDLPTVGGRGVKGVFSSRRIYTWRRCDGFFTREFKVQAVKLVTEQGYSFAEAARKLDLRESLLRRWKAQLASSTSGTP